LAFVKKSCFSGQAGGILKVDKALVMLRLIPEAKPQLTERCSGHGGKWVSSSGCRLTVESD